VAWLLAFRPLAHGLTALFADFDSQAFGH
jgi:hypothetical protein